MDLLLEDYLQDFMLKDDVGTAVGIGRSNISAHKRHSELGQSWSEYRETAIISAL